MLFKVCGFCECCQSGLVESGVCKPFQCRTLMAARTAVEQDLSEDGSYSHGRSDCLLKAERARFGEASWNVAGTSFSGPFGP